MRLNISICVVAQVSIALGFMSQQGMAKNAVETALRNAERTLCKVVKSRSCTHRKAKPHISTPIVRKTFTKPMPIAPIEKPMISPPGKKTLVVEKIPPVPTIVEAIPPEPTTVEDIPPEPTIVEDIPPEPTILEDIPPEPTIEIAPKPTAKPKAENPKPALPLPVVIPTPILLADVVQCQAVLTKLDVSFTASPAYAQQGSCVVVNPVQFKSYMSNGQKVDFPDQPILNCEFALQFMSFIQDSADPTVALQTSSHIAKLYTGPGFVCRGRNGDSSAKMSEHAKGNAVDIERLQLADGRIILVKDAISSFNKDYSVLTAIRHSACTYFTTVLGPGANAAHASHFHFDAEKRGKSGTYRICQ